MTSLSAGKRLKSACLFHRNHGHSGAGRRRGNSPAAAAPWATAQPMAAPWRSGSRGRNGHWQALRERPTGSLEVLCVKGGGRFAGGRWRRAGRQGRQETAQDRLEKARRRAPGAVRESRFGEGAKREVNTTMLLEMAADAFGDRVAFVDPVGGFVHHLCRTARRRPHRGAGGA